MHCVMLIDCVSSTPSYVCQLCEFCTALCVPVVRVSDCVIRVGCASFALPYAYRLCEFWIALCSSRESNSSENSDRWRHRTPLALWGTPPPPPPPPPTRAPAIVDDTAFATNRDGSVQTLRLVTFADERDVAAAWYEWLDSTSRQRNRRSAVALGDF